MRMFKKLEWTRWSQEKHGSSNQLQSLKTVFQKSFDELNYLTLQNKQHLIEKEGEIKEESRQKYRFGTVNNFSF